MVEGTDRARFEQKFRTIDGEDGCWLWTAGVNSGGYGSFRLDGQMRGAHRIAYELYVGEIPIGLCVLHVCDVMRCVKPGHLFIGTRGDNAADRKAKGRNADRRGSKNPKAKLTERQVREIKALGPRVSQVQTARQLGVSKATVNHILRGRTWAHV